MGGVNHKVYPYITNSPKIKRTLTLYIRFLIDRYDWQVYGQDLSQKNVVGPLLRELRHLNPIYSCVSEHSKHFYFFFQQKLTFS